jgi:glucose-6-phosphate isomerase, archaeal
MIELKNPDIRYLYDIKEVLYDKEWLKKSENFEIYYMYRGLKTSDSLRYDITVIPANMLGKEFVKTKGHYHPSKYGEIYTVLSGQAIYLLQKINDKGELEDLYAVETKEKESVIIPSGYGHITINPGKKELKMSNWVCKDFKSEYEEIENKKGGAYYYTENGWIENKNYEKLPKLKFKKPTKSIPSDLSFLKGNN